MTLRKYQRPNFDTAHRDPGQYRRHQPKEFKKDEEVLAFWDRYNRNDGEKDGREVDGVEALRLLVAVQPDLLA